MNMKLWIDEQLGMVQAEKNVENIKSHAQEEILATADTIKRQGSLQREVIQKTTTYYLGKASGTIN